MLAGELLRSFYKHCTGRARFCHIQLPPRNCCLLNSQPPFPRTLPTYKKARTEGVLHSLSALLSQRAAPGHGKHVELFFQLAGGVEGLQPCTHAA